MIHVNHAHKEFIGHLEEKNRAQATILAYGKDIEQLLEFMKSLGKHKIHHIQKDNLEGFLKKLEGEGYTKKSISRKINSIKTFFRFLKVGEYITDDPATLILHPKFETPPPRILSQTEYRALRDAARTDARALAIIELLLQTGVRIGELANIKVADLIFDEKDNSGQLNLPASRTTIARSIPLNKAAHRAIKEYLSERPAVKSEYVFVTRTGKPLLIRNIRSCIDRYFKKAGVKGAKVNDLRHTFIAHHIKHGANLVLISRLAGHKRLSTTEKYLKHIERSESEKYELAEL